MIRFLWENKWDDGALTVGGNEQANFLCTNTQHRWWSKTWKSLNATTCALINDLGSALGINVVALKYNNFTAAATIDLYYDADDAFDPAAGVEHLTTISQDVMILYFSGTRTYEYWKLTVIDAAVPAGYHELGRVFLGAYWSPTRNFTSGGGRQKVDDTTELNVGEEGHISSVIHQRPLTFQYTFERIPSSDLDVFIAMFKAHGMVGGFFITEDSDNPTTTTYYVQFAGPLQIKPEYNSRYTVTISLVEAQ